MNQITTKFRACSLVSHGDFVRVDKLWKLLQLALIDVDALVDGLTKAGCRFKMEALNNLRQFDIFAAYLLLQSSNQQPVVFGLEINLAKVSIVNTIKQHNPGVCGTLFLKNMKQLLNILRHHDI
jgi:hypothetical protein